METFERGFADAERAAAAAAQAASTVVNAAKQMQRAAIDGDIAKMRKASERLGAAVDAARQEVANATHAWPFTPDDEGPYLQDEYERELLETARREDLRIQKQEQRLVAFPSVIRILPTERAVRVDRKKVSSIRPSKLVAILKANQSKKPKFAPDRFLEALYRSYRLVAGKDGVGTTVRLAAIYNALTLLPGAAADYGQSDFGRDIFLLDRSGVSQTKSGPRLSFPRASGSAKGVFTFVSPDGETVTYFGVRFAEG